MMSTSNLKALEKAVKASPADAASRLVYADALEEAGKDNAAYTQRQLAGHLEKGEARGNLVVVREDRNGLAFARSFRLSTGKQLHFYRFRDAAQRDQWVAAQLEQEGRSLQAKAGREQARRAARASFANPYKVGDVLYNSWGYDQTNIDWYEVVEVKARSVVLRSIAGDREYTHHMAGTTAPRPGRYLGEPFRVTVQVAVYSDNKPHYYLPARHGSYSVWAPGQRLGFSEYA